MALTPPPATPQRGDRTTFSDRVDAFLRWLVNLIGELNAFIASLNIIAFGGAYSLPFILDLTSTADSDPGSGKIKFSNATNQLASTSIFLDLISAQSVDVTTQIAQFGESTSLIKGSLKIVAQGDATRFLVFNVTALSTPTGYRGVTVIGINGSSSAPFVNNDTLVLQFTRNGDKGLQGISGFSNIVVCTSTRQWTPPAGISKAKITIQDGGYSGVTSASAPGGQGGNAGVSIINIDPSVTYTATVGSGGNSNGSSTRAPGGSSSFSGSGLTTVTSSNSSVLSKGGLGLYVDIGSGTSAVGGGSIFGGAGSSGYGVGGSGSAAGNPGIVLIEY